MLTPPALCASNFIDGNADIALLPSAVVPRLKDAELVTDFCIGAEGEVRTVVVVSNTPIEEVRRIWLDAHSRTSVQLTGYLAARRWKIAPQWLDMSDYAVLDTPQEGDAFLLIGDKVFDHEDEFIYSYDLAAEWREATGLPFAFAVWVARKGTPYEVTDALEEALTFGVERIYEAVQQSDYRDRPYAYDYLTRNIDFLFDNEKRKGSSKVLDLRRQGDAFGRTRLKRVIAAPAGAAPFGVHDTSNRSGRREGSPDTNRVLMITIYLKQYNKIIRNADPKLFDELGYDDILWIDLLNPTIKEQKAVEGFMEISLQTKQQVEEIESTSKYSETENAIISNSNFFVPTGDSFVVQPVSFIISNEGVLVSVRTAEFRTFREAEKRLQMSYRSFSTGYHLFISLLEVRIDYDADLVEMIAKQVAALSKDINSEDSIDKKVIHRINALLESTMLLRENIFDRQRVLSGILRSERFPNDIYPRLQLMIKDVNSLINHADFSFQRLDYIQDGRAGAHQPRAERDRQDSLRGGR